MLIEHHPYISFDNIVDWVVYPRRKKGVCGSLHDISSQTINNNEKYLLSEY
jgi:hypothetical protein